MNRCRIARLLPLLLFTLASCRGGVSVDVVGSPGTAEDWLCDPSPDGGWACTRGSDAAAVRPTVPLDVAVAGHADTAEPSSTSAGPLFDVPATHYAVQLIALRSEQALRDFVAERKLADTTTVRVENGGRLHFALLAGVHPSRAAARRAVAAMAPALQALGPWIRSIGNLREAMARADRLAEAPP